MQLNGERAGFFGIDFHLVPPERGWEDVVTRLLDVISRSGAENEPAFLDHLGVWIEHIIEASRYDDLESPTLRYRPVELTVHAIEETTGPFHALFPVERVPTRQLFVCREKRTVWQHHTTVTKQLHDPWLPEDIESSLSVNLSGLSFSCHKSRRYLLRTHKKSLKIPSL